MTHPPTGRAAQGLVRASVFDEMLAANRRYAGTFEGPRSAVPKRNIAVVTCMDARIDPTRALGLEIGDAHIIRNAGGRVVEALRSLAISQQLLETMAVAIIHHDDCGLLRFGDDELRDRFRDALGGDAADVDFLTFADIDESVREDLALYRSSALVRQDIPVRGFVYDDHTGLVREVRSQRSETALR